MTELESLIQHLDFLIGILEVSDESIYNEIKYQDRFGYGLTIDEVYSSEYENYQNVITTSALILGFTHFENYISKMVEKLLIIKPELNKRKFTLKEMNEILPGDLVEKMANIQSKKLMISQKLKLIENTFPNIDSDLLKEMDRARKLRNCIIHENGFCDAELALCSHFNEGDKIILTSSNVNQYGLNARKFAKSLWHEIENI